MKTLTRLTKPITEEQLDRWIEDLRSGQYAQGHSHLIMIRTDSGPEYCCLGVLQHQCKFPDVNDELLRRETSAVYAPYYALPKRIQELLAYLNDSTGATFLQIADHLTDQRENILSRKWGQVFVYLKRQIEQWAVDHHTRAVITPSGNVTIHLQ